MELIIQKAVELGVGEIIPVLTEYPKEELEDYAAGLFDRLCNPFIDHSLLAISLNTTSKWKARVLPRSGSTRPPRASCRPG